MKKRVWPMNAIHLPKIDRMVGEDHPLKPVGRLPSGLSSASMEAVRHEPGVSDGLSSFLRDLKTLTQGRTIDEIRFVLGEGDLVFVAAKGTHDGKPCAYIDLYRVENAKLVEHWGFSAMIPPQKDSQNENGML